MKEYIKCKEGQLKALLAAGRTSEAIDLLLELVVFLSEKKQFRAAEQLHQKMMDIDSLAIGPIVAAAEKIQQEKNKAIDKKHMAIWKSWYARLVPEERSAFFFASSELSFEAGTILFQQHKKNDVLFFVDQGALQLVSVSDKGSEALVRRIGPGEFAGEDTFFRASICTTSLMALSAGCCRTLKKEALAVLDETVPALRPKLLDFCMEKRSASEVLQSKGINRRAHKRVPAQGLIVFQIVSAGGAQGSEQQKIFKGRLSDISAGGLSFYVKTANEKGIHQLLGKVLGMKFVLAKSVNAQPVVCKGVVTGVLSHLQNEHSVHVRFEKLLNPMLFA
ncbi:cyclic nucleotide-binding domain-containing protein [Desulfobotulus sp. H1]|uniref:Cyclic nucleotide-binding domain-containing protein n=1 Tax=Desulfobotulus pelophilus TaxID=2823377 RepID=A0ABT3NDP3_9BACT|nr:cyclic nucleotide-binding domain-containing protein [Desulfobotulus pelophilus]MCW7755311.1 cyclic nucleotide-binding domain-containing protein [Desulfobotulus pelophilus]